MIRRWGTVRGYGGPIVVMLSAVDVPPGPIVCMWQQCMVRGDRPWLAHLIGPGGPIVGGTIGSVTDRVALS